MKDANGAIQVGASHQVPNEDIVQSSVLDYKKRAKDILSDLMGREILKHFEIQEETPPWLHGTVLHVEAVVMSVEDYRKLKKAVE